MGTQKHRVKTFFIHSTHFDLLNVKWKKKCPIVFKKTTLSFWADCKSTTILERISISERIADEDNDEDEGEDDDATDESDKEMDELYDDDGGELKNPEDLDDDGSDIDLDGIDDEDLSDMEFNDNDDDDDNQESPSTSKVKKSNSKKPKVPKLKGLENVFVSAEEFADMLEEQGRSKTKHGSSAALSDADGASAKQLDWESERNQKLRGKKRPHNKKFKGNDKNVKKFKRRF